MAVLEKLLSVLFLGLLVIALPLSETARITFNELAITLIDAGVILAVLFWLFTKKKIPSSSLKKPVLIFAAALLISLLINVPRLNVNELLFSSLYLVRWVFYALLYFVVLDISSSRKKIEKGMVAGGALLVIGGFIQYFLYPDLRNLYYAGWDEHLYRMFSTFLDPNFAGIFFVLYLLFTMDKLLIKPTLFLKLFSLLTTAAIIFTFSRSAYISLAIGLTTLLFLKGRKSIATTLAVIFILAVIVVMQFIPKTEGTNLLRIASGEARLDSMRNAITIFKDHPIFGVGFNSYRYAQRNYGFLNEEKKIVHSGAGTDNSFLFILATSGIIGFIAFLYLLFNILLIKESLITASMAALIVSSLFINSLFYPPVMLWMWILLGTLPACRQVRRNT